MAAVLRELDVLRSEMKAHLTGNLPIEDRIARWDELLVRYDALLSKIVNDRED